MRPVAADAVGADTAADASVVGDSVITADQTDTVDPIDTIDLADQTLAPDTAEPAPDSDETTDGDTAVGTDGLADTDAGAETDAAEPTDAADAGPESDLAEVTNPADADGPLDSGLPNDIAGEDSGPNPSDAGQDDDLQSGPPDTASLADSADPDDLSSQDVNDDSQTQADGFEDSTPDLQPLADVPSDDTEAETDAVPSDVAQSDAPEPVDAAQSGSDASDGQTDGAVLTDGNLGDANSDVDGDADSEKNDVSDSDADSDTDTDSKDQANDPDTAQPYLAPHPYLTEAMAANVSVLEDEDGDDSDWIELHNPYPVPVDLAGLWLSDDPKKPAKWQFPQRTLAPGGYLVVFASDKNRAPVDGPLHTNFKLSAGGETLVLSAPNLQPLQTLVLPYLVDDVSFGPSTAAQTHVLLGPGGVCQWQLELASTPTTTWTEVSYPAELPQWQTGTAGFGFELDPTLEPGVLPLSASATSADLVPLYGPPLADSSADWSTEGEQGAGGWYYGRYDRSADADKSYAAGDFEAFPAGGGDFSASQWWDGATWRVFGGPPPWTSIGFDVLHPSGGSKVPEQWPIRRWVAPVSGPVALLWRLHKVDDQGSGVTGLVLHNGDAVDTVVLAGSDKVGVVRLVRLAHVQAGDTVDFALSPVGSDGLVQEGGDSSNLQVTIWAVPDLSAEISTDLASAMPGVTSALRLRCPLELPDTVTLTALALHLRADDGAVVWLDGQQVAAVNGPADATWTQAEAPLLSDAEAEQWQTLNLTTALAGWGAGPHVLALRGVNASADDSDFLLAAELTGEARVWHWDQPHYFTTPTPGGPNVDGSPHLGPLLYDLTPTSAVTVGQPLKVQIRAVKTTAAVAGVSLKWRLGYGMEKSVTLVDNGSGGDVLAGDGIYTTTLTTTGLATGQMIRWAAVGTDAVGKQSRLPAFADPDDTEAYHGTVLTTLAATSQLPVLQLFVESMSASYTQIGTHGSLWYKGEFYDNVRIDLHGQSTQAFPKKSWDIDFPRDHRFLWRTDLPRYKDINLLSNYADKSKLRNTLAYEIHQAAGTDWHVAEPVRVLVAGKFWGLFDLVEDGDGRWLQRLGRDPDGALYKVNDGLYSASLAEKKTREQEDKSDLAALIAALQLPAEERRIWLLDHVNLPAMVGFVASYDLTGNRDCCHKNFYAYRDTQGSGEWWLMPWDVDLSLGRNWSATKGYLDDTLDAGGGLRVGANNNALLAALFALPEFDAMYLRRLRTLMDTVLQPPDTDPAELWLEKRLDAWQTLVATEAAADATKWPSWGTAQTAAVATAAIKSGYLNPRRAFLYGPQLVTNGGKIPLPAANVQLSVTASSLSGGPDEWLALTNLGTDAVDLSGATLSGPRIGTFAPGTVLPAGMTVYLTPDVVAFRGRTVSPKGGEGLWALGGLFTGPSTAPWQLSWPAGGSVTVQSAP